MWKPLATRNQRAKGFKLKYGFQIVLLIAVGIWLLYHLKHSLDKRKEYEQTSVKTLGKLEFQHENRKLGRKGFQPWTKEPKDLMGDEKIKVRSGGGDDEIVGRDQDKMEEEESEEVEDLIDEEDKEREEESEVEEAQESEDLGKQFEDVGSLKDKEHHESKSITKAESEKSRVKMRQTQSIGSEFEEFRGVEHQERTDSTHKVLENVTIEHGSFQMQVIKELADRII